jgi:hypothetical protein
MREEIKAILTLSVFCAIAVWIVFSFTGCAAKKYYFERCDKIENGGYVCE